MNERGYEIIGEAIAGWILEDAESPFVADGYIFDFEGNKNSGTHERHALKYNHD